MYLIKINTLYCNIMCFIFVFFLLFGIKISILDLSILVPIAVLIVTSKRYFLLNKSIFLTAVFISVLFMYQTFLQLILQNIEFDSLLRLVRAMLVVIIVSLLVSSAPFSRKQIVKSLFFSLVFHCLLLIIAALSMPISNILSLVSGNVRVLPLRSSGLLAGYDIAGLLCILGALMLSYKIYRPSSKLSYGICFVLFGIGCYFTSRVSMAIYIVIFLISSLHALINSKINIIFKILFLVISSLPIVFVSVKYIIPIVEVTFSLGIFQVDPEIVISIVSRHAVQHEDQFLWSDMFYLPKSVVNSIFGIGIDELNSDVGYVKDIFRYGFIGLIYSIGIYFYVFKNQRRKVVSIDDKNLFKFAMAILVLTFLLTFKNNYFFTRAIFPFVLLVSSIPFLRENSH